MAGGGRSVVCCRRLYPCAGAFFNPACVQPLSGVSHGNPHPPQQLARAIANDRQLAAARTATNHGTRKAWRCSAAVCPRWLAQALCACATINGAGQSLAAPPSDTGGGTHTSSSAPAAGDATTSQRRVPGNAGYTHLAVRSHVRCLRRTGSARCTGASTRDRQQLTARKGRGCAPNAPPANAHSGPRTAASRQGTRACTAGLRAQ